MLAMYVTYIQCSSAHVASVNSALWLEEHVSGLDPAESRVFTINRENSQDTG